MALEPLETFLDASKSRSFDNREARATVDQRSAEVTQSWLKLTPIVSLTASYTRNQYDVVVVIPTGDPNVPSRTATITPQDQGDLIGSVTVPLLDIGAWERVGAAKRTLDAARAHVDAAAFDVEKAVTRDYYQVVAQEAVLEAARHSLDTANKNLTYVTSRKEAGVGSELDWRRAVAEVERNKQSVADAEYQVGVARLTLATASGKTPGPNGIALAQNLAPEAPLEQWLRTNVDTLPSVRAQVEDARSLDRQASATRWALFPTASASAQERVTNATGFGQSPYYTLTLSMTWRFDASVISAGAAQSDAAAASRIRADRLRQQARDDIQTAWLEVQRDIEKSRAASSQVDASNFAVTIAHQRYDAGTANFLDVTTAERDAFSAEVSRIQADVELAFARAALRIASGQPMGTR